MSFILGLTFNHPLNESVQIGDMAYFTPITPTGTNITVGTGFNTAETEDVVELGKIVSIINADLSAGPIASVDVLDNLVDATGAPIPSLIPVQGVDFIMFGKDRGANSSSLVGYYAEIKFINDSTDKAELFSVGSEVVESSK